MSGPSFAFGVLLELWQAALFGLVQGLTEFLPVSSSGHLRVVEHFTGLTEPITSFDVSVHAATLLAVLLVFSKDVADFVAAPFRAVGYLVRGDGGGFKAVVRDPGVRGLFFVFAGSIPTGLIGYYAGPWFEAHSVSIQFVAAMFIVNSFILLGSKYVVLPNPARRLNTGFAGMNIFDSLVIGAVQGLAVIRGISRSGSTISTAMMLGMDRDTAGRFSFLLCIPAIVGATALSMRGGLGGGAAVDTTTMLVGGGVAFVTGLAALKALLKLVHRGRLHQFAWYTLFLGLGLLAWHRFGDQLALGGY